MTEQDRVGLAAAAGARAAQQVLAFRRRALEARRESAEEWRRRHPEAFAVTRASPARPVGSAAASRGVLVAEGDSWFDYPWTDVLRVLEDVHLYDVYSVAHRGDRVEEMAYAGGQLEKLTRLIEKLLRQGHEPRAVLLSGGGNDIAGDEFAMLLNHALSPNPGLNTGVTDGVIDDRARYAYVTILQAISTVCQDTIGRTVPIVVHGYDYPVPDGRGFLGGWWLLPGPWLEPGFREKGYTDLAVCTQITTALIDRFNAMLASVAALPMFAHVRYVDLRNTLSPDPATYRLWWDNELHPTEEGFVKVAGEIAAVL
jgi:lysophospholipase L1-like esterase